MAHVTEFLRRGRSGAGTASGGARNRKGAGAASGSGDDNQGQYYAFGTQNQIRFTCPGYGYASGSGYGYIAGFGYAMGSGFGTGEGTGCGKGKGIKTYCGTRVRHVGGMEVLIYQVRGNVARGAVLNRDLTLTPVFIIREGRQLVFESDP